MSDEAAALRAAIRLGLIGSHVDRPEFDAAVARVYEVERSKEQDWDFCTNPPCGCARFACRKHTPEGIHFRCCSKCSHEFYDGDLAQELSCL